MIKKTNVIVVKLLLSVFLITGFLGSSSGNVKFSGDEFRITGTGSDLPSGNPEDKTLIKGKNNPDENRDSGTKDVEQSNETKINSDHPTIGSFSIQIAAFNDEDNASTFISNNKQLLDGYDLFYKSNGELFKVFVGHFNSLEEASYQLREVYDLGYVDTFITELSRQKK